MMIDETTMDEFVKLRDPHLDTSFPTTPTPTVTTVTTTTPAATPTRTPTPTSTTPSSSSSVIPRTPRPSPTPFLSGTNSDKKEIVCLQPNRRDTPTNATLQKQWKQQQAEQQQSSKFNAEIQSELTNFNKELMELKERLARVKRNRAEQKYLQFRTSVIDTSTSSTDPSSFDFSTTTPTTPTTRPTNLRPPSFESPVSMFPSSQLQFQQSDAPRDISLKENNNMNNNKSNNLVRAWSCKTAEESIPTTREYSSLADQDYEQDEDNTKKKWHPRRLLCSVGGNTYAKQQDHGNQQQQQHNFSPKKYEQEWPDDLFFNKRCSNPFTAANSQQVAYSKTIMEDCKSSSSIGDIDDNDKDEFNRDGPSSSANDMPNINPHNNMPHEPFPQMDFGSDVLTRTMEFQNFYHGENDDIQSSYSRADSHEEETLRPLDPRRLMCSLRRHSHNDTWDDTPLQDRHTSPQDRKWYVRTTSDLPKTKPQIMQVVWFPKSDLRS